MSASSKKKLRKEQNAAAMTEKQQRERAEARKVKTYSIVFVTAMILVVSIALGVVGVNTVNRTGIIEKSTVALTVNDHDISVAELNYFYFDAINSLYSNWYDQYEDMTSLYMQFSLGLDPTASLGEQVYDSESGKTWADYFVDTAKRDAQYYYALYDDAKANGYTMTEAQVEEFDAAMESIGMWASLYGLKNADEYLQSMYGFGASEESFRAYSEVVTTVQNYVESHEASLTYEDADLRAHEKDNYNNFCSYNYASYQVSYGSFLHDGTKDEDGNTSYSDEQIATAMEEAKEVADSLATVKNVEELDAAIALLPMNAELENAESTKNTNVLYSNVTEAIRDWVSDESRKENDVAVLPYSTIDSDGEETVSAYIVVVFGSKNDNTENMSDVRHCLVKFSGGTTDSTGNTIYSDEEMAEAKAEAEQLLADWKAGEATEESFIAMVKDKTDDTASKESGGLYENVNPDSNYVPNFLNWSIDDARTTGDTGIVETEYGYHIMYYVGDTELTYRDYLITEALRTADHEAWYTAIEESATVAAGNTDRVPKDVVMASSN